MKLLRSLLKCLATAAALAAFAAAVVLTPPFQTFMARTELDKLPDLRSSLGSVWARFGRLDVNDLKLEFGDAVLTLPSAEARLPIVDAIWHRQIMVRGLVAKGWTLDLSRVPEEAAAPDDEAGAGPKAPAAPAAAPAQAAASAFGGILSGWRLPADVSLDGVDLDGEVLVSPFPGKAPVRVHVTVTGGGMAAGREGSFAIDAETIKPETGQPSVSGSLHGRMVVAMETSRTVGRAGISADISARRGPLREDLAVSAAAAADRGAGSERYTLELARGARQVAAVHADFQPAKRRVEGTWRVGFVDSDIAPFMRGRPLPQLAVTGAGGFDADSGFAELHALGNLSAVAGHLGALVPSMEGPGNAKFAAKFDLVRSGQTLRFTQLLASCSKDGETLDLVALQPFDVDEATSGVKASDEGSDLLSFTFGGLPLAWLGPLPAGFAFAGGNAVGGFLVRASGGGFTLRPKAPLSASGVSIRGPAGIAASGLDLSLSMTAVYDAKQLEVNWAPLALESSGQRLASLEAKGIRPAGAEQPMAFSGTWSANTAVIASQRNLAGLGWLPGSSAKGDFTGSLGASSNIEGKIDIIGRDPARTVSATYNADRDADGAVDFLAPIKVAFGTSVSEISAEGSWGRQKSDPRLELKLTSDNVDLDQLLVVAAPLAAAGGGHLHSNAPAGARDAIPFWGNWAGNVKVVFDKLRTADQDLTNVGGNFEIDRGSVQLEGGHGELPPKEMASVEGSISFDPDAAKPYSLKGTLAPVANLDSALLLPAQPGQDPVIEGHFTLAGTVTGSGASLDELVGSTQEEFQLSSASGILRLLTTDVSDAVPEAKEPVADSLDTVGNFVGSVLLGIKGHSIDPSKNKVSKSAEAVLSFTNQVSEIEYDRVAVTAVRGPDRTIRLVSLEMTAPDEHLKGTGQIAYAKGLPVSQEPLSVELRLGVRDVAAKLLTQVGLLSTGKDELGFPLLNQPVRFGGSLSHIDDKQWHDLLAKAMAQKPAEPAKKDKAIPGQ